MISSFTVLYKNKITDQDKEQTLKVIFQLLEIQFFIKPNKQSYLMTISFKIKALVLHRVKLKDPGLKKQDPQCLEMIGSIKICNLSTSSSRMTVCQNLRLIRVFERFETVRELKQNRKFRVQ